MGYSRGFDVSHWQGTNFPFAQAKAQGFDFAILKATEGNSGVDPLFEKNLSAAVGASLVVGAYHYYHPELSPTLQAKHFCRHIEALPDCAIPPVCDFESLPRAEKRLSAPQLEDLHEFMLQVGQYCDATPMLYGSPSLLKTLVDSSIGGYPLWIANYDVPKPAVPPQWTHWTFWQYTNRGQIGDRTVDLNFFNGTQQDLRSILMAQGRPHTLS